jgi:glycosyltransferase involved in cell wall biosynthesis
MSRPSRRRRGLPPRERRARRPRPTPPTLGLALIVRDEEETLPALLSSVEGAFDQVVLVDTGSVDDTVAVFERWCARTGQQHVVESFTWVDDFAAARNYADSLLTTDWECWADADDVIVGAANLREIVARAPARVSAYAAQYDYAFDDNGKCDFSIPRERLVRRGVAVWIGRVHPYKVPKGGSRRPMGVIAPGAALWGHRKTEAEQDADVDRDGVIFRRWQAEAPHDPLLLGWLETGSNPAMLAALVGWGPATAVVST